MSTSLATDGGCGYLALDGQVINHGQLATHRRCANCLGCMPRDFFSTLDMDMENLKDVKNVGIS